MTTQTKAQQKALNELRNKKTKAVDVPEMKFAESAPQQEDTAGFADYFGTFSILQNFSWKRSLCAVVASLASAFFVAKIAAAIISILLAGAVSMGAPMFLGFALAVLVFVIGAYAAVKAGAKTLLYVASGEIDRDVIGAYNKVKSWFGSSEKTIEA